MCLNAILAQKVLELQGDSLDKGDDEHAHLAFPHRKLFSVGLSDESSSELDWTAVALYRLSEKQPKLPHPI